MKRFAVLLTRELPESRPARPVVQAESLCIEAPSKRAARSYLVMKYPDWELLSLDPAGAACRRRQR